MHGVWIDGFKNRYAVTRDGKIFSVPRPGTKGGVVFEKNNNFDCVLNGVKISYYGD